MAPRDTEDNSYAKFWGGKQRTYLRYVIVFLAMEWTISHTNFVTSSSVAFTLRAHSSICE